MDRLKSALISIKSDAEQYYDALILSLVDKVLNLYLSMNDIFNILEISYTPSFKNQEGIKEFISFDDNEKRFRITSSVTAKLTIQELSDLKHIIGLLVKTAEYAIRYSETEKYSELLRGIISFSAMKALFADEKNSKIFFVNYFEALSKNDYFRNNHFFWLQYAVTCSEFGDFTSAQIYIDNAYAFAPKNFVPFQINNQQALLLLKIIHDGYSRNLCDDFEKAHSLLMKKIESEKDKEYHVIKLFSFYGKIKNKFISPKERELFKLCNQQAYNRVRIFLRSNSFQNEYKFIQDELFTNAFQ